MQHSIPCVMMRGGTSRGLYFRAADLPVDSSARNAVLLAAMGSADPTQIDGAGGATSVTSKVAIVSPSAHDEADVDYLFAQIGVDSPVVDTAPSCGNILAGVAPFAIENGFIAAQDGETTVRVRNVNSGALIDCVVQTPNRQVSYNGDTSIDGVPGTAAPIRLVFRQIAGSKTGRLLPTGQLRDTVCGVAVSCIDLAIPMVLVAAESLGRTGYERKAELDADAPLLDRLETIRRAAGRLMGMGDVSGSVVPKIAMIAKSRDGSGVSSRYFTPDRCHAAHAATGAICIAGATRIEGTIAQELACGTDDTAIRVEHPQGAIEIGITTRGFGPATGIDSAFLTRTARPIFSGQVFVPQSAFPVEPEVQAAA